MTRKEIKERNAKICEELERGRHPYRVAERYGLTEWRVRQIKREADADKKGDDWVNEIIYPKVKMWFKRNVNGLERMKEAGLREENVICFFCDQSRTLSVKTINIILDVIDMSFEEAFERK